jgi:MFS family permease
MADKPETTLYLLGKYLGLVFLLPSGAIAGYLIGLFLEHYLHWGWLRPAGIVVGVIGGLVKLFQELIRDSNRAERDARTK